MAVILGIDVGTEGTKVIAVREDGTVAASAYQAYQYETPLPGWVEQQPLEWWDAVVECLHALWGKGINPNDVAVIGVTGQMHSPVLLDENMEVLRKSILWNDTRATAICHQVEETLARCGDPFRYNSVLPGFTAASLLWIQQNEPDVADRISTVLLPKDYVKFQLTGTLSTDSTDASGTGVFDFEQRTWNSRLIDVLGLPASWFPPIQDCDSVVGTVHASAATITGLHEGTLVIAGAGDNPVSGIGTSQHDLGRGFVTIGTSGAIVTSQSALPEQRRHTSPTSPLPIHVTSTPLSENWSVAVSTLSAGACLRWFRDSFEVSRDYASMMEEAKQIQPGADGLLFVPHLAGTRSTAQANPVQGAFFGLQLVHTMPHFARAIVEGVSFSLRDCLGVMEQEIGTTFSELTMTGGASNSELWAQILADVLGCTIRTYAHSHGAAFGVAMLAGIGVGIWHQDTVIPQPMHHAFHPSPDKEVYDSLYERYCKVSRALMEI